MGFASLYPSYELSSARNALAAGERNKAGLHS
jgi:hypothetical protein